MRDRLDFLSESWRRSRPDMDIEPWGVWGRITRIHEVFLQRIKPALARHGLTFTEYQTLGALVLSGPPYEANPTRIARFNLLTSGGLTNVLIRMERRKLIERRPDPNDGRGVVVRITENGLARFNGALTDENRVEHDLLAGLEEEEAALLSLLLKKTLLRLEPGSRHEAGAEPSKKPETAKPAAPARAKRSRKGAEA